MYPHRIRLRGPWRLEPAAGEQMPAAATAQSPCRWRDTPLGEFRGTVRHLRSFGLPRRLDSWERVWLTCAGASGTVRVMLNGETLGEVDEANRPFAFEVTGKLRERNTAVFDVTNLDEGGGLWGEVALEIRASAWLENLALSISGGESERRLLVSGRACGSSPMPLDAFVLADRHVVHQTTVQPTEQGVGFVWEIRLSQDELPAGSPVAVELVHGSTNWYREEQRLESARPVPSS